MSKSTTIVTTTTALSAIASTLSADTQGHLSKQAILNSFARGITGPRHDWGYLTQASTPIIQRNIPAARLHDLKVLQTSASEKPADDLEDLTSVTKAGPRIKITARSVPLFDKDVADLLAKSFQGRTLCISECFSTDTENEAGVQCMFDPRLIEAGVGGGLLAHPLWGSSVSTAKVAGPVYFASASSPALNDLISEAIVSLTDVDSSEFRAFYLPNTVIVIPDYISLPEEEAHHQDLAEIVANQILVFIDETLGRRDLSQARSATSDFLARIMNFMGHGHISTNFAVA